MKTYYLKLMLLGLMTWILASCDLIGDLFDDQELSGAQITEIIASVESYSAMNDSILLSEDPASGFLAMKQVLDNDPLIEETEINSTGLYVTYKNGGTFGWMTTPESEDPPYWKSASIPQAGEILKMAVQDPNTVNNKNVAIINQQVNDQKRILQLPYYNNAEKAFTGMGFNVSRINGAEITIDFLRNDLNIYGTHFFITHGGYTTNHTWMLSGEESTEADLLKNYKSEWEEGQLSVFTIEEIINFKNVSISYIGFSEEFIRSSYDKGSFPNSFFYTVACQALMNSARLAEAFVSRGCGVFVGWDETNTRGNHSGKVLFDYLMSGETLSEALNKLPERSRTQNLTIDGNEIVTNLEYYPEDKGDFYLVTKKFDSEIVVTTPSNNASCTNRVQKITGYVKNAEVVTHAMIEVNNNPLELKITDGNKFEQSIVLKQGRNEIQIITQSKKNINEYSLAETEMVLTGNFPTLQLFSKLSWNTNNTDVDLHLLPPGVSKESLFTSKDCYFNNRSTTWNANLDVDERFGFGPEHITIPSLASTGTYTLYIHYYQDHNPTPTPTDAYLDIETLNGEFKSIGPLKLTSPYYGSGSGSIGTLVKVAEITYPEGKIKVLNEYISNLKSAGMVIPSK